MRAGPLIRAMLVVLVGGTMVITFARAQGVGPGGVGEGDIERGERILAQNCAACHAIGATGDSPNPASPPFRTLSENYPVEALEEALGEGILVAHEGVQQMPQFAFSPEDVGDIIAYLQSVQPEG
ncbi:c-type cytochrome [Salinarimonas ramus]|uniref:Cytochrome c family protein n=1 Tax=Salinarimonas ramus TaxID=690164 RepID=A0A917Q6S6_9HYPH|nr:cytochrome c [Salinarimonas ramus]GGK31221.1 cytochrome c family protein [Salinarimonas ramus]